MLRRQIALLLVAATTQLAAVLPPQTPIADRAAADFTIELELGEDASVEEVAVAGANPGHLAGSDDTYPCGEDPVAMCRTILVSVTNPFGDDATKGRERASLSLALSGEGVGDAAVLVYESDAEGARGPEAASSDTLGSLADEAAEVAVTTTEDEQTRHYLVEVFFHAWVGSWSLEASFA